MSTEPQQSNVPPPCADDSVGRLVLLTISIQIGIALLTLGLGIAVSLRGFLMLIIFEVVQWAALIPLCLSERRKGYSKSVRGILMTACIVGCIVFLLSAACSSGFR